LRLSDSSIDEEFSDICTVPTGFSIGIKTFGYFEIKILRSSKCYHLPNHLLIPIYLVQDQVLVEINLQVQPVVLLYLRLLLDSVVAKNETVLKNLELALQVVELVEKVNYPHPLAQQIQLLANLLGLNQLSLVAVIILALLLLFICVPQALRERQMIIWRKFALNLIKKLQKKEQRVKQN
jgi:hypothetical protein